MIQQITDGSNTCFAQKCSSVTAVMNGNIPRNIYTHTYTIYIHIIQSMSLANLSVDIQCKYHVKAN